MSKVKKYYAVKIGKTPGVYKSWNECQEQIKGFSGAEFKGFKDEESAKRYVSGEIESNKTVKEYKTMDKKACELSMKKNSVSIYTDGSWGNVDDNKKMYAGGIVVIENGKIVDRICVSGDIKEFSELRNVAGELLATVRAIDYIDRNRKDIENVFIFVDYIGLKHWSVPKAAGGWKRKNQFTKSYGEYVEKMKKKYNMEFFHVKGHNNDQYNEEADTLASYSKALYLEDREFNLNEFLNDYSYINNL